MSSEEKKTKEKKPKEKKLNDDVMKSVAGGTEEFTYTDFFEDEEFDKELVDDGTGK